MHIMLGQRRNHVAIISRVQQRKRQLWSDTICIKRFKTSGVNLAISLPPHATLRKQCREKKQEKNEALRNRRATDRIRTSLTENVQTNARGTRPQALRFS